MDNEIWKPVKGYEDYYEISNLGNIRSKPQYIKQRTNERGYHMVELYDRKGGRKTALVHRLVAEAFLEMPDNLKNEKDIQVNHIDGVKSNNRLENLEYCNQSHNMKEAYRLGLRKYIPYKINDEYRYKMSKLKKGKPSPGKEVQQFDRVTGELIKTYESATAAEKENPEFKASSIRDAANERRGIKTYKGFVWKFTGRISNGETCRKYNPKR